MSDRWDSGRITGDECNGYSDMHEGMKEYGYLWMIG